MAKARDEAVWFASVGEWRSWLETHHATAVEIWLGLSKSHVRGGVAYPDAVDEALCFGWIDGITHTVDADGFTVRFTPRKAKSSWSAINLRRISGLRADGRVQPAGLAAFERRQPLPYQVDEAGEPVFGDELRQRFGSQAGAWEWFESRTPSYRRQATVWVMSAKREDTRERRLRELIDASAEGRPVPSLS
jgi:uncharacterized protein YdeI (YjbR/CyaY-like superfamily)